MSSLEAEARTVGRPIASPSHAWLVWSLAVAFVVYLFSFQTGYSIVNADIKKDVGLTVGQVGTIAATYTWAFAVCQLFSGALLDRLGSRLVIPPAIALVTLGIFLFATASSFHGFILAQLVLALGACAGFVGAGYIGGQWFGIAKFSFMFGLVQFAASLFSAFGQNAFTFALNYLDWRDIFFLMAAFGVVLFGLGVMFIRNPEPVARPGLSAGILPFAQEVLRSVLQVAKIPHVWIASAWGAIAFGAMFAAGVVWAPKFLMVRGLPQEAANFATSVMWLGLAAGCLIIPRWSDLVRRRKQPAAVGLAVQFLAMLALIYLPSIGTAGMLFLCFTFGAGAAAHMLAFSTAADVVPPQLIGTSAAVVNGMMFLTSGILITLPGQIAGHLAAAGMPVSMLLVEHAGNPIVVGLAVSLVVCVSMRETCPT